MKKITYIICFMFLFSLSADAQFQLKKLDDVVVSMSEGETIEDYSKYLGNYFDRIEILEAVANKGQYEIIEAGDKKFLQGAGTNAQQQNVVFRIEINVSSNGLTLTKVNSQTVACVAVSCEDCDFSGAYDCACAAEGDCKKLSE